MADAYARLLGDVMGLLAGLLAAYGVHKWSPRLMQRLERRYYSLKSLLSEQIAKLTPRPPERVDDPSVRHMDEMRRAIKRAHQQRERRKALKGWVGFLSWCLVLGLINYYVGPLWVA